VSFYVHIPVYNVWDEFGHLGDQNLGFWTKNGSNSRRNCAELMTVRLSMLQACSNVQPLLATGACTLKRVGVRLSVLLSDIIPCFAFLRHFLTFLF